MHKICEKLHKDLIHTEKKYFIDNQKSQLKDAKIEGLQTIIDQLNADLNLHDDEINAMKIKLEQVVIENHEHQQTIAALNKTIVQCKCNISQENLENENMLSNKTVIKLAEEHMSRQFEMLKIEYNKQYQIVKKIQNELERVKEKSKEKNKNLKRENEELKEKLVSYEIHNKHLLDELSQIRSQTIILAEKECVRQHELAHSRQVIRELRQTVSYSFIFAAILCFKHPYCKNNSQFSAVYFLIRYAATLGFYQTFSFSSLRQYNHSFFLCTLR